MSRMKKRDPLKNIDLMILDIDDSFIYHRTVAIANRLFLSNICEMFRTRSKLEFPSTGQALIGILSCFARLHRFRPAGKTVRRIFILSGTAIALYFLNALREIVNAFGGRMSNWSIIEMWADTVIKLRIKEEEYMLSKETLKKNLYPEMFLLYKSIRDLNPKMRVAAISENLGIAGKKDPIEEILSIDVMRSNTFTSTKGIIDNYTVWAEDAGDKKVIADAMIDRMKPKRVAIVIDDYEDLSLLDIKNLKVVIHTPKIRRFIEKERYDVVIEIDV